MITTCRNCTDDWRRFREQYDRKREHLAALRAEIARHAIVDGESSCGCDTYRDCLEAIAQFAKALEGGK